MLPRRAISRAILLSALMAGVCLVASTRIIPPPPDRDAALGPQARPQIRVVSSREGPYRSDSPGDPRSHRLARFFQHYNCPEPLYIRDYLRAADEHGLDYRLLPAISIRETQCGVTEREHNRFGFHPESAKFPSVTAALEFIAERVARHPYYRGRNLRDKLFRYNPYPAYPGEVLALMRQIEPEPGP
jgi:hypothetical protein